MKPKVTVNCNSQMGGVEVSDADQVSYCSTRK
jgi:hypothetical protein